MLYIVTTNSTLRSNIVIYVLLLVSSFSGVVYPVLTVLSSPQGELKTVELVLVYRTPRNEGMISDFLVAV